MRCDINVSVRERGSTVLGTRTEIKNMNSIKAIVRAIEYESQRHIDALETGCETLVQETRRWDDAKGQSFAMRDKEDATDYRYFPNPDIMPIYISEDWINAVRETLPEPAHVKRERLIELGLPEYDAKILTSGKDLSDIFDAVTRLYNEPKDAANWIIGELLSLAKAKSVPDGELSIDCDKFAKLMELVDKKTINRNTGKKLLVKVWEEQIDPEAYVAEHKLGMVADTGLLESVVTEVLAANEKSVLEYKGGNEKVLGFLMGQVMRRTQGKADPAAAGELLRSRLDG